MNTQQFVELIQDLEQIASEIFEDQEPDCDFSEDHEQFEMLADFNLWSDRS